VESNPLWDKRFWNLQVSDASEKTMQLRVLATSADSSKSWDLRCKIREDFIAFIQQHHPQSLPLLRAKLDHSAIEHEVNPMSHEAEMSRGQSSPSVAQNDFNGQTKASR
jgi:hypothetical protein